MRSHEETVRWYYPDAVCGVDDKGGWAVFLLGEGNRAIAQLSQQEPSREEAWRAARRLKIVYRRFTFLGPSTNDDYKQALEMLWHACNYLADQDALSDVHELGLLDAQQKLIFAAGQVMTEQRYAAKARSVQA